MRREKREMRREKREERREKREERREKREERREKRFFGCKITRTRIFIMYTTDLMYISSYAKFGQVYEKVYT